MLSFWVPGKPQQKGSFRPIVNRHTGKAQMIPANLKAKPWQQQIAFEAAGHMVAEGHHAPLEGPIECWLTFHMPRPKTRKGKLRPDVRPDLDKLVRTVLDGLTGTVWVDDGQVCGLYASKVYAGPRGPGVSVAVWEIQR